VLLDRRLGHHQVGGDLVGRGGRGEGLVGQRGPAQRGQHVELAAGELGDGRPAQFDVGGDFLRRDPSDPAAGRTEAQHVALVQYPARDRTSVNPCSVS
jgi:hypothetical protein